MSAPDDTDRYVAAMHAVQSGVKYEHETGSRDGEPKHLRVGVCSALINDAAIARLLIEKGIFTEAEYTAAVADQAEREVTRYEERLSAALGATVKLR